MCLSVYLFICLAPKSLKPSLLAVTWSAVISICLEFDSFDASCKKKHTDEIQKGLSCHSNAFSFAGLHLQFLTSALCPLTSWMKWNYHHLVVGGWGWGALGLSIEGAFFLVIAGHWELKVKRINIHPRSTTSVPVAQPVQPYFSSCIIPFVGPNNNHDKTRVV